MFGVNTVDWRSNAPIYWVLERKDGGHAMPTIVFESWDKNEAMKKQQELATLYDENVYRVESRTDR